MSPVSIVLFIVFMAGFPGPPLVEFNPSPKDVTDGMLTDWGRQIPFNPITYEHLFDNEAQYLDNSTLFGLMPPGGPHDPPLAVDRLMPGGGPLGNGFNIVSALVSFDPNVRGGTYWLAIDLPGPTNDLLSEGFHNTYVFDISGGVVEWYPIPFDADCNESRATVDDIESGGFGTVIATIDEKEEKWYKIFLWVGGDETMAPNMQKDSAPAGPDGSRKIKPVNYNGPGFPITMIWKQDIYDGVHYYWKAWIDKQYLLDPSEDLVLGCSDCKGMCLVQHSNPHSSVKPHYDIELGISGIISRIFPLIDVTKVGYPMEVWDIYHSFVAMRTDCDGDFSRETELYVGINVPLLPLKVLVEHGYDERTKNGKGSSDAAGESIVSLIVTIPKNDPQSGPNGMGYVMGDCRIEQDEQARSSLSVELCSEKIELNGVKGVLDIADSGVRGRDWVIIDKRTREPYLFYPSDPTLHEDLRIEIPLKFKYDSREEFLKKLPAIIRGFSIRGCTAEQGQ